MANLYVFHQELDGPLWYSVFDGTYWTADFQAPNIRMSAAPSAISWGDANDEFHNDIIIFHQGSDYNARLWGTNFEEGIGLAGGDIQIANIYVSNSPAAVVYNGLLYVFQQEEGDGRLWYSVFDGSNWAPDTLVPNIGMSGSPSAVAWVGGITVFHQGSGINGQLWYTYSPDGTIWGPDTQVQNVGMTASLSALVF